MGLKDTVPDVQTGGRAGRAGTTRPGDTTPVRRVLALTYSEWGGPHHKYRLRAGEAAEFERLKSWSAAAQAWEMALEVATGGNVQWCRSRHAWCIARSLKPGG